jgi:hypothetical protein
MLIGIERSALLHNHQNHGVFMSNATSPSTPSAETTRLIPLTKWPEFHPWPSVAGLRSMVFNAKKSGFEGCIVRVGSRILINETKFFKWCESQPKPSHQTKSLKQKADKGVAAQ